MDSYTCRKCGKSQGSGAFYKRKGAPDLTWCKECYRNWYAERSGGWVDRECDWCGGLQRVTARRAAERVFCSRSCKDQFHDAVDQQARLDSKLERPCLVCGTPMPPSSSRSDRVYCSMDCRRKIDLHQRKRKVIRERLLAAGEPCGICGQPVDGSIKAPDPMSASLDHITPLAAHGDHEDDNLQLTHLGCNARKGARS